MNPSPAPASTADRTPVQRRNWAGEPTMLLGEDADGYNELFAQVSARLIPNDVLEDMLMRDVVDLAWDVRRLRRMKANLLRLRARNAMSEVLAPLVSGAYALAEKWSARDAAAVGRVEAALESAGLSMDTVMAAALRAEIDEFERIDAMIADAENRRSTALSEIERHRASFAQELRDATAAAADPGPPQPPGGEAV